MADNDTRLAELQSARLQHRKDAKSGNPAKRATALRRLWAVERMIADLGRVSS